MTKKITLPITDEDIKDLKAGDSVLLTGTILTGRDAAHKRLLPAPDMVPCTMMHLAFFAIDLLPFYSCGSSFCPFSTFASAASRASFSGPVRTAVRYHPGPRPG